MDVNKLRDIMFSGGDSRDIGHFGEGYVGLIGLFAVIEKGVLVCEERRFPKLPAPSEKEREYLANEFKHGRLTHDPETAKEVTRTIWHARSDLPICKSWKELTDWLNKGKPASLCFVMVEPWYPAGRADVGLVLGDRDFPNRYRTIIAVEIGDVHIGKPLEAFQNSTEELWIVPYPEWGTRSRWKYYVFRCGADWGKPWWIEKENALRILEHLTLDKYTKDLVKIGIERVYRDLGKG